MICKTSKATRLHFTINKLFKFSAVIRWNWKSNWLVICVNRRSNSLRPRRRSFQRTTRRSIPFGFVAFAALFLVLDSLRSFQAALWRDVTTEYLQFNGTERLRKTSLDGTQLSTTHLPDDQRRWSMRENDRVLDEIAQRQQNLRKTVGPIERKIVDSPECLHDRLMSEIRKQRALKPIGNRSVMSNTSSTLDTSRKRIRPVQVNCRRRRRKRSSISTFVSRRRTKAISVPMTKTNGTNSDENVSQ